MNASWKDIQAQAHKEQYMGDPDHESVQLFAAELESSARDYAAALAVFDPAEPAWVRR